MKPEEMDENMEGQNAGSKNQKFILPQVESPIFTNGNHYSPRINRFKQYINLLFLLLIFSL